MMEPDMKILKVVGTMHMASAKIRHAWDEEAYHKYQGFNTPWEWPLHIP